MGEGEIDRYRREDKEKRGEIERERERICLLAMLSHLISHRSLVLDEESIFPTLNGDDFVRC